MNRLGLVVLFVAGLVTGCGKATVTPPDPVAWHTLAEGEALARAQHRPALFFFGASWDCGAKELEHVSFPDPEVRSEMRRYVAIHIDCTDDEAPGYDAIRIRFGLMGTPTMIAVGDFDKYPSQYRSDFPYDRHPDPTELFRTMEFVKPAELAAKLRDGSRRFDAMQKAH